MKIITEVNNCAECMYSITNSSLHDDAFTSTPLMTHYVCQAKGVPDFIWWEDGWKGIHSQCPLR